ncbi:Pvc16 family protein [Azonexus sp. IMCC34842]|uniref:Pvc16 family protein n=1 Tax=Azonexus sp. IMCC34842 TaxID=3420950 RepID=UPI003D10A70C
MFHDLDLSLRAILEASSAPTIVRDAEVVFDRPAESFNPDKTVINLFLYDVRENAELRNNEPVVERQNGVVTIRRPPLRVACSYLVTAWIEAGVTGEANILGQHQLLGEVLRLFSRLPAIPANLLHGELASQRYPVPLLAAQGELVRNPAEFWSALGGKLRPSITLSATIAMDLAGEPVEASEVSTKEMVIHETSLGIAEPLFHFAGTVRHADTQEPIGGAELTLVELGLRATSDADGRYSFSTIAAGHYQISASRQGYVPTTVSVAVPGTSPGAFDLNLTDAI